MTSNSVLWNFNREWSLLTFCFNFLFLIFFFSFFLSFFFFYLNSTPIKRVPTTSQYHYKLFNQPNIISIQYHCFSSTAPKLGTNSLIAFRNGFKSVAQSFHTAFIFVFNSSSELNGSPALPCYTFVFTRSQKK